MTRAVESRSLDDRALMKLHADVLFSYDPRGRMVCSNEADGCPAPRLFLGLTAEGCVARFNHTLPDDAVRQLTEVFERHRLRDSLLVSPPVLAAVREELERHGPITGERSGPVYRFPQSPLSVGQAVQVTQTNVEVLRHTFPWLYRALPAWEPCFAILDHEAAVSLCFSSRLGSNAAEAGVETLPAYRGRGYAAAVTAAWGTCILAAGRVPLYSTRWQNLASQGVARRVGLIMFGGDITWM